MRTTSAQNQRLIEALNDQGISLKYARSIIYGHKKLNDLEKAKKMSKAPHYISIDVWEDLYKGE